MASSGWPGPKEFSRIASARLTSGSASGYLPWALSSSAELLRHRATSGRPGPFGVSTMNQLIRIAALLVVLAAPVGATHLPQTEPDPSLSPQDVVSIQIEALRNNDTPYENRGVEVTFNFASPANKRMTGPLERFKVMVRNPIYGPMINHRKAEYENLVAEGDFAKIDVILTSKEGVYLGYRFILSRQHGNRYEGSWMTDAVIPFDIVSL